jgi:hypothetical protein
MGRAEHHPAIGRQLGAVIWPFLLVRPLLQGWAVLPMHKMSGVAEIGLNVS